LPKGLALAAAILIGIAASLISSCRNAPGEMQTIIVGVPPLEQNALLYVAEARQLFESNGLKVTVKTYDTGVATINALLSGEVDVAELAEFPFIKPALEKQPVRIIAVNDRFENDYLLVRKDRGISNAADLKGKRIGVIRGTVLEFYLGRFLELNGISFSDVTIADTVNTSRTTEAIINGEVDAVVAFQPHVSSIQNRLKEDVFIWPAQSNQLVNGILVSNVDWLSRNSDRVQRFLKALASAEKNLIEHPDEARNIVRNRLNLDEVYISRVWSQHQFGLSLDLSLILAMNDEARWMIDNGLTSEKTIPDFREYIYLDGLKAVKPEAVNITR